MTHGRDRRSPPGGTVSHEGDDQDPARHGPLLAVRRDQNAILRANCTWCAEQRGPVRPHLTSRSPSLDPPKPTTKHHLPSSGSRLSTGPRGISDTDLTHSQRDPYPRHPRSLAQQLPSMLTPATRTISDTTTLISSFIVSALFQRPHPFQRVVAAHAFSPAPGTIPKPSSWNDSVSFVRRTNARHEAQHPLQARITRILHLTSPLCFIAESITGQPLATPGNDNKTTCPTANRDGPLLQRPFSTGNG